MSYADKIFIENCKNILENGTDTQGQLVRPKWPDGAPAYTIKKFGIVNRYYPSKEFPALTIRKTGLKSCMDEILWIYQKKSNNIHDLKPHIWDAWADENGSIGTAYGYQVGKVFRHHKDKGEEIPSTEYPSICYQKDEKGVTWVCFDQMDAVLYDLKHAPYGRRILISLWNSEELHTMRLQPCCWNVTFNVTDEGKDKLVLNMMMEQRSNDTLAANNWNVAQYSLLQMMVAQVCDMYVGEFVHCITDMHIYDRHVPIIKEIIERPQFDAPVVKLNPDVKNFYDFTTDDLIIENYKAGEQVTFEVAE